MPGSVVTLTSCSQAAVATDLREQRRVGEDARRHAHVGGAVARDLMHERFDLS